VHGEPPGSRGFAAGAGSGPFGSRVPGPSRHTSAFSPARSRFRFTRCMSCACMRAESLRINRLKSLVAPVA